MYRRTTASVFALLALSACGSDEEATRARDACIQDARNAVMARVVIRYYEQGKLGPKAKIRRTLEGARGADGSTPRIFDESGHMLRWEEMDKEGQSTLLVWFNNDPKVEDITHEERDAAWQRVKPDCD
jgi:hypothetical protein